MRRLRPDRVFYGWWIVAAGAGFRLIDAVFLTQAYGAYVVTLRQEFGWSKTALSGAFALAQTEHAALGPVEGWLIDRFGPRAVIRVGLVMFGAGFMLFSQVQSLPMFLAVFAMLSLGASTFSSMPSVVAVVNWFERRRARALGLMSLGSGIGGILTLAVVWSIEQVGWRETAFASGVLILVIGLPLSYVPRHRPEEYGLTVDGLPVALASADADKTNVARPDFTPREAMATRAFWLLAIAHTTAALVVGAIMVHLVPHISEDLHHSLSMAGVVVAVLTASQLAGHVLGGFISDRFSKRWIAVGAMAFHGIALFLLAFASVIWLVFVFAVIHGLAWGTRGPLMNAIRADYFGRTSFGVIMGFSHMVVLLGMIAGPLIAGYLADRTGNYESSFLTMAVVAMFGSVLFSFAGPPAAPQPAGAQQAAVVAGTVEGSGT